VRDDDGSRRYAKKECKFSSCVIQTRIVNQINDVPIVYVTRGSSNDEAFSLVCGGYTRIVMRVVLAACRQLIKEFKDNGRERN